ncbi:MAG TPA: ABC transporter transmembrane domain-containing protein [Gemmatimonadaceae bacterium]|nr:ABC transporter transmembrane domain-containing protein [Gemmatimonadaceae bacterium]
MARRPSGLTNASAAGATAEPGTRKIPSPGALRPLVSRMRPYRVQIALASVALLASAGITLAFPLVVRYLLDAAFVRANAPALNRIALILVGLFAAQGLLNFGQVWVLTAAAERIVAKLRDDVFAHLVRLSPGFFTERRSGELTSRLATDVTLLQSVMTYQATELSRQVLFLLGGVVMLTLTHPQLTVTTLAVVPVIVGTAWLFGRALKKASTGVQDRVADAMGSADEAFAQIRTVQSFTREAVEARRFSAQLRDVVIAAVRRAKIRGAFFGVITFCAFGGVVIVLWQGGRLVLARELTPGALVEFLFYAFFVAAAVGSLASLFGNYQEAVGAAHRVFELLATTPTVVDPVAPVALPRPVRGDVRFEHVTFAYGPDLPTVLHDVTFHMAPGDVVALVGPSGAGKTTVASLITRFWDVPNGTVMLDGIDVRCLSLLDLRGAVGLVPQDPALFSGTVRDNIAYARPDASDDDVISAARAAHAWEFIERLPSGLETRVGERGVKLSGGQRQRIAIARVFLKDPAVVVLDEATSSLDSESEQLVNSAMERLLTGRSTLIIAHRLSTVRRADRLLVLDAGRIVEEGSHAELLAGQGVYARLYRVQYPEEAAAT